MIYQIASDCKLYFLSRSRRFGKSLLHTKVADDETAFHIAQFMHELRVYDVDAFMERLEVFFAGIPYDLSNIRNATIRPCFISSSL